MLVQPELEFMLWPDVADGTVQAAGVVVLDKAMVGSCAFPFSLDALRSFRETITDPVSGSRQVESDAARVLREQWRTKDA